MLMTRLMIPLLLMLGMMLPSIEGFSQKANPEYGKAAYYADRLHGRKTASGRLYDKTKYTCAHKTHRFGTMLRVTRLDNNRSVVVEVTDRGPFKDGFVVDLSRRAAEDLNMIREGIVRVKVEILGNDAVPGNSSVSNASTNQSDGAVRVIKTHTPQNKPSEPATYSTISNTASKKAKLSPKAGVVAPPKVGDLSAAAGPGHLFQLSIRSVDKVGYGIQLAVVSNAKNAMAEAAQLESKWPGKVMLAIDDSNPGRTLYKILLGPFPSREAANSTLNSAMRRGYKKAYITTLSNL